MAGTHSSSTPAGVFHRLWGRVPFGWASHGEYAHAHGAGVDDSCPTPAGYRFEAVQHGAVEQGGVAVADHHVEGTRFDGAYEQANGIAGHPDEPALSLAF